MPCAHTVLETIKAVLPNRSFDAVDRTVQEDVLHMAFKVKHRDRAMIDELICDCLRASKVDQQVFCLLMQYPRAAWISALLSVHGTQPYGTITLADRSLSAPISELNWDATDGDELLEIISLLKPTFQQPRKFLSLACSHAAWKRDEQLLLRLFEAGGITLPVIAAHLHVLARNFDVLPALGALCAEAFDAARCSDEWNPAQMLSTAIERPHVVVAILLAEGRIPRCPIKDYVPPLSRAWLRAMPRIATNAHAQLGLITALQKLGTTAAIFATPDAELCKLIERFDSAPEDPNNTPFLALFPSPAR